MTTPTVTPLERAQFESVDACLDPSMPPEHGMPGRLIVDVAFGGETVFSFEETTDEAGHWAIEVFMEFEDGTPAPFDVGDYQVAVRCVPAAAGVTEPAVNYVPLTFTVVESTEPPAEEPPAEEPEPAAPVVRTPSLTG